MSSEQEFIPPSVDGRLLDHSDYPSGVVWLDSERSFQRLFVRTLAESKTPTIYGWPGIVSIHTEYRVGGAILDAVAFHYDGSITAFELKRSGLGLRDYMTGIGQLMHASVQFGLSLAHQGSHRKVRLVLAVPDAVSENIGLACIHAGIEYMPFGKIDEYNKIEREFSSVRTSNG